MVNRIYIVFLPFTAWIAPFLDVYDYMDLLFSVWSDIFKNKYLPIISTLRSI
jgi:hypothetical protein